MEQEVYKQFHIDYRNYSTSEVQVSFLYTDCSTFWGGFYPVKLS